MLSDCHKCCDKNFNHALTQPITGMWLVFIANLARYIWLLFTAGYYSPKLPTGRLWVSRDRAKSHIHVINNLLTSNIQSSWESLKP